MTKACAKAHTLPSGLNWKMCTVWHRTPLGLNEEVPGKEFRWWRDFSDPEGDIKPANPMSTRGSYSRLVSGDMISPVHFAANCIAFFVQSFDAMSMLTSRKWFFTEWSDKELPRRTTTAKLLIKELTGDDFITSIKKLDWGHCRNGFLIYVRTIVSFYKLVSAWESIQ